MQQIELRFHGFDLKEGGGLFKKFNSQVFVQLKYGKEGTYMYYGGTEQVKDNTKPYFQKPIIVDYSPTSDQYFKFLVLSRDEEIKGDIHNNYTEKEFLGESEDILLSSIIGEVGKKSDHSIKHKGKDVFSFTIKTYENKLTGKLVSFKNKCTGLDKKDLFGKSDPFFLICKCMGPTYEDHPTVYKSPVIKNTLDPEYPELVQMKLGDFNGGDNDRELRVVVYDWNSNGVSNTIGTFKTTTNEIINGKKEFDIISDKKAKGDSKYVNSGVFYFIDFKITDA